MTDIILAYQGSAPVDAKFNNVQPGSSGLALTNSLGSATGKSLTAAGVTGAIEIATTISEPPTGAADWVSEVAVARWGHYKNSSTEWASYTISGFTPGEPVTYYSFCSAGFGRLTEVRVNGGTSQIQDSNVNTDEVLVFSANADGSGNVVIEHRQGSGSSGSAYQNAGLLSYGGAADTTAPTISSASVPTAGDTIAVQMSEAVQVGSGGSGGWTISLGDATISSAAVDGTDNTIINLTPSRTLLSGESFTIGYTQPGDGFQDQAATPNDLATLSGAAVTNNSSQVAQVPGISAITVQKDGVAVQATDWEINIALNSDDSEVYSGTSIASNASGSIAAINTTGGSVGDAVTVEGFSASNNYGFKFTQNLEDNA